MVFADRLRELRSKATKSREELAQASGLARGTIRDYEQGKRKPTLESAAKLADALGVSVDELVKDDGRDSAARNTARKRSKRHAAVNNRSAK
jgi:transcriptional regulator with XRE-family HTH domain